MTETHGGARQGPASPSGSRWADGVSMLAGMMLGLSGTLSFIQGIAAVAHDTLFSTAPYEYRFDLTSWGWIHLVVGVALMVASLGVLAHRSWGRGAGLGVGAVSLVSQFMFIPHYPLWSISVMVLDLVAIWTLSRLMHE